MSNPSHPNSSHPESNVSDPGVSDVNSSEPALAAPAQSFKDILSEYEQTHSRKREPGSQRREGTVIALTVDSIVLDIGFKTEGVLPLTSFPADKPPKPR